MNTIKDILIMRDCLSEEEAIAIIHEALYELRYRQNNGQSILGICQEYFELEDEYINELLSLEHNLHGVYV